MLNFPAPSKSNLPPAKQIHSTHYLPDVSIQPLLKFDCCPANGEYTKMQA